jgi:hypothetical protein
MALTRVQSFNQQTTASTTNTSGSTSTAVDDIVVVSYVSEDNAVSGSLSIANTGTALTWNLIAQTNTNNNCKASAWWAKVATAGNITVTVTCAGNQRSNLCVDVYTGAHQTTPVPAGNVFSGNTATSPSQSITPTATGSMIRMLVGDWNANNTFAAIANCTIDNTFHSAGFMTAVFVSPTTQPLGTGAFTIGVTDTGAQDVWIAYEIQAAAATNQTVTPSQASISIKANTAYALSSDPAVSSSNRISVPWQNISTRGKVLGHFWLDTVTAASANATATAGQSSLSITANNASASATSTVTVAQSNINITGASATASATRNATTSVNNGVVNLTANTATAIGTSPNATASANQAAISLVANSASVLLSATATVTQPQVNIIANAASALTSTIATVNQAQINISANAATASSTAIASVAQASISLTANNATASATSGGNASVSVNQASINILGANATASATQNQAATVSQGVISLTANNATASATTAGNATATATQAQLNIAANSASVTGTATVSALQAQLSITANNAGAIADSTANAGQGIISLIANSATAIGTTGGNVSVSVNQAIINIIANNATALGDPVVSSGGGYAPKLIKPNYNERKKQRQALEDVIKSAIERFDDIPHEEAEKVEKKVLVDTESQDFTDLIYAAIYARNLVEDQLNAYLQEMEDEDDFMLLL